ncbi:hypothetical protein Tco_0845769 [Tanacetum coccineum]
MAKSTSPDITPKEEPVTLDKPESPNYFLPSTQVEFTLDEITFTTNNESHPNQEYFMVVLLDSKIWVSTPTGEVRGEIGINTFRNALRAQYLPYSSMYVPLPSITTVRPWFAMIRYNGEIMAKGTLKKSCLPPRWRLLMGQIIKCLEDLIHKLNKKTRENIVPYPRFISLLLEHMTPKYDNEELTINLTRVFSVHNWILKPNQPKEPPFTDHMMAIYNLDVPVDSKASKYSSLTKEASKSKSSHSNKETKSSLAMDTSPIHPSPPTLVVGEMHKEAQQAASGPTSLGDTNKTKSAGDGLKTAHTDSGVSKKSKADEMSKKIKLEDLSDLLKDTRSAFFTPDSLTDEPVIISDESEEEEVKKAKQPPATSQDVHLLQSQKKELEHHKASAKAKTASLKAKSLYPDINQLTMLLVTSLKPELTKLLASRDFASYLSTELKELPSKGTELSEEIKELKQNAKDMELELPGDVKEILSKLDTFTSTISSLSSQVAELKNIQWELLAEFLALPHLVTNTLNRFATLVENASGATTMGVPSADKATASPTEGEKDTDTNLKNKLVDLLGIDIVTRYYNKKLLYEKYYEKMKKRRKRSKIINCDVLTKKGPISLKVYREDGTTEFIEKFKSSDLQLAE